MTWALTLGAMAGLTACSEEKPMMEQTSYETVTVEKHQYYHRQVEVLHEVYVGTHELMDNGKASYLEVLTAQESLLSAQLNEASNLYSGAQAIIALYIALGGGTK